MAISTQNTTIVVSKNSYIDKALEHDDMLTVIDFITNTNYPIDKLYIDKFWATLQEDKLIYVNDALLKWMGFEEISDRQRKQHFLDLLKINKIEYNCYTNEEYGEFLTYEISYVKNKELYPELPRYKNANKINHILLNSKSLRYAMLAIGNNKSKRIRDYYLVLEDLFKIYIDYQMQYKERYVQQQLLLKEELLLLKDKEVQEKEELLLLKDKEVQEKDNELKEKDKKLNRLSAINQELVSYKKFVEKNEVLYIGTTQEYARQGLFKVSKSKDVIKRTSTHNTSRVLGDEFIIVKEVKCSDALELERYAKHALSGFRCFTNREYYNIPYNLLLRIINQIEHDFNNIESFVNEVLDEFMLMKESNDVIDWTKGLPEDVLDNSTSSVTLAIEDNNTFTISFSIKGIDQEELLTLFIDKLNWYKSELRGRKPCWTNVCALLTNALKEYNKRPGLKNYKNDIVRLCSTLGLSLN